MIRLIQETSADDRIKALYEEAFPLQERRPWPLQKQLIAAGRIHILRITKEDRFAGFVFFWKLPAFSFIEHFAVDPASRGGGTGTQVMKEMETLLGTIILEVEPPDTEQAIRRIHFYERLGYHTFPEPYQQPSYYPPHPPLDLRLMHKNLPATANFAFVRDQLYELVYHK